MDEERRSAEQWDVAPATEEIDLWPGSDPDDPHTLVELVNRVLDRGVVITGDVTISVAGVDLVYLGLNAILSSVATARETLGRPVGRSGGEP